MVHKIDDYSGNLSLLLSHLSLVPLPTRYTSWCNSWSVIGLVWLVVISPAAMALWKVKTEKFGALRARL